MVAYRIAHRRYPIFDGRGALLRGGRWNSAGTEVIYAAENYAGALLEQLVHARLGAIPKHHASILISIPDEVSCETLEAVGLLGWAEDDCLVSRAFGDRWLAECRTAVLRVPGVVVQGRECNVLLNPAHAEFPKIVAGEPEPVVWDMRLFPGTLFAGTAGGEST